MKKKTFTIIIAAIAFASLPACGPKCKTCSVEAMGVKGPETKVCGDQLKQFERQPNVVCR